MASRIIYIQSVSDIITNSSSEVFCQIDGEDDLLEEIYQYLSSMIRPDNLYDDLDPGMELITDKETENKSIRISLPYSYPREFFKAGLNAIMELKFKNVEINYDIYD